MKKIEQPDKLNSPGLNRKWQRLDKDPAEEKNEVEQVTAIDPEPKVNDADLIHEKDQPE